ncbi:MAG: DNA topoisomerase VI subunit B [Nanoarchaeota archaeon]
MTKTKAEEMAALQQEISISEFFTKNRHLLGFDNPRKALLMAVKEGVDNSLDACQDAEILPEIYVEIKKIKEDRYSLVVEDNGPGIVKEQIPRIFGKLLYGSKFHRLRQSMGQQGIGISAAALYGQLTTGKNFHVISKIGKNRPAYYYELHIDTKLNEPKIVTEKEVPYMKDQGTRLEFEMEAKYQKGKQSADEYLKEIALSNPHAKITFKDPEGTVITFPRAVNTLPKEAKEIKPHPYGIELGMLISMLHSTTAKSLSTFLQQDFSRVSASIAQQICDKAEINMHSRPNTIVRNQAEKLYEAIQQTKIMSPPTNCLVPIGAEALEKGMRKEIDAEFYATVSRPPSVYRGNPFSIEVGIAYGGSIDPEGSVQVIRFANRVPLLYQQGAGAIQKAIIETAWKNYNISQSKGSLPQGPILIIVSMVSVWVPFTSEAKEAIASYDEIIKEMKLALQEAGRKLSTYIRKTVKAREQREKINLFEKYIPEVAEGLSMISSAKKTDIEGYLTKFLKKNIGELIKGLEDNDNKEKE